jgi:hypothetical protein
MHSPRKTKALIVAAVTLVTAVLTLGIFERPAQAIIGRPLTPLSYAGVARRTTRRAVAATAVAAPIYW